MASIEWKVPFSDGHIRIERIGRIVLAHGNIKFNQTGDLSYVHNDERIPAGFRPMFGNTTILFQHTGSGDGYSILVDPAGATSSLGNPRSAYATCTGSWLTVDPWPVD